MTKAARRFLLAAVATAVPRATSTSTACSGSSHQRHTAGQAPVAVATTSAEPGPSTRTAAAVSTYWGSDPRW
ncbi:MAG: hypothetical protein PGN11_15340 [Quadrisphaera sp.]